jgi:TRAP-type C4-dicarboxylate transport system permease small subunit
MGEPLLQEDRDDAAPRPVPAIARPVFFIVEAANWIASACLLVLAGLVVVDVVGRLFSSPLSSGSDIGAMLMVGLIFFAISGTQVDRDHVSMDALVAAFPLRLQRLADRLSLIVCLVIGCFLTYGTFVAALKSYNVGEMALGALMLPLWPAKATISFGFCLYTLVVFAQLFGVNPSGKRQDAMPPLGAE